VRRAFCEEEVRLNARLAPGVYLGVVALRRGPDGRLRIESGDGSEVVAWLVRMRRPPAERMLDAAIRDGAVEPAQIEAVAHLLDPAPREPAKWLPQARRYLAVGAEAAVTLRAPAGR
jgi:aminoglycoside phosphotransferase family enzyme